MVVVVTGEKMEESCVAIVSSVAPVVVTLAPSKNVYIVVVYSHGVVYVSTPKCMRIL